MEEAKGPWIDRREVRSETSNRIYVVARHRTEGYWACSCPGWKSHRNCKHVRAIAAAEQQLGAKVKSFVSGYKTYEGERGSIEQWQSTVAPKGAIAPPALNPVRRRRLNFDKGEF